MNEKWKEYYSDEQLKQLQKIELENLQVFISVCKQLGLEYFLYGGTLLGSVKYKGFVPWDDDIDVALPRDSYEKFIREAPGVLPEDYFIQNPYNCKYCPYPYTKLRRHGTKYVEYVYRNLPIETGIYIDIYPVDHIPDDEKKRRHQFKRVHRWIRIFTCRQARPLDQKERGIKRNAKKILKFIAHIILLTLPSDYCINQIDKYMKMYNGDEKARRYSALNSPVFDNIYSNIYPFIQGEFEGIEAILPNDYLEHLKRRYGDIESLPPAEERIGHIPYLLKI